MKYREKTAAERPWHNRKHAKCKKQKIAISGNGTISTNGNMSPYIDTCFHIWKPQCVDYLTLDIIFMPSLTMKPLLGIALLFVALISTASAAPSVAAPDPALVDSYEKNPSKKDQKLSECRARQDALSNVECISAQEVEKRKERKMFNSKCRTLDIAVFVPPNLKGSDREAYLKSHVPSETALSNCGKTKEQWLTENLK